MDNKKILNQIDNVMKDLTDVNSLGDSVLQPEKFGQFVRQMQDEATILEQARFINMDAHKVDIDRIAFLGKVLHKGVEGQESDKSAPDTYTNQLVANELMAIVSLTDQAVRRNIEQENLESTIIDLLGEAAGRDLEEYAIFSSEDWDPSDDGYDWDAIDMTDGWIKKAENQLWEDQDDVFTGGSDEPEDTFQEMLDTLPKKYLQNREDWVFYVPWEIEDDYRNILRDRGTQLGDAVQIGHDDVYYKGIPIEYAPMLERYDDKVIMLQHPDNMVWGIFHEVTLESEREAKKRQTDFVLTFEGDAHYEDENAAVVAIDATHDDGTDSETEDHALYIG